jgi:hypothetical protein
MDYFNTFNVTLAVLVPNKFIQIVLKNFLAPPMSKKQAC